MRTREWFRNSSSFLYHCESDNWVWNGKALCGADIRFPAKVAVKPYLIEYTNPKVRACKRCMKKATSHDQN